MAAAMRNERFAARQTLTEVYRAQLSASATQLRRHWKEATMELEKLAATAPAPVAFDRCVRSGLADAVVLFDEAGHLSYPNSPSVMAAEVVDTDPAWQD